MEVSRQVFLANVDVTFAAVLRAAPPGDWPSVVLSPHMDMHRLAGAVKYGAAIMDVLISYGNIRNKNKQTSKEDFLISCAFMCW